MLNPSLGRLMVEPQVALSHWDSHDDNDSYNAAKWSIVNK